MVCSWKPNWDETRQHFLDWWDHQGLVCGAWGMAKSGQPIEPVDNPGEVNLEEFYTNPTWRASHNHYTISHRRFPGDILPMANVDTGPGSLALYLGSEPTFSPDTVWFNPSFNNPDTVPPIQFSENNRWWQILEQTLIQSAAYAQGKYLVGCPDLVENLDTLSSLRGAEPLLHDLVDRPGWVIDRLQEIQAAWFDVYERVYHIIRQEDGSSAFGAFYLWGPGKTVKVQCDFSALISPRMFRKYVLPTLTEQCDWLDRSLYHLDGHQCICHLDLLLSIDSLDAIEWTPDPTVPSGGSPEWYPMYRKILEAGKSVQAVGIKPAEVIPLLDAVGGNGMYLMIDYQDQAEYEKIYQQVEPYRSS